MINKKSIVTVAAAAAIAVSGLGIATVSSSPVSALGYNAWLCGQDNQFAGSSSSTSTSTKEIGNCGTMKVQLKYSPVTNPNAQYYTGQSVDPSFVKQNTPSGTIARGGKHSVSSCGWIYSCGPFYT